MLNRVEQFYKKKYDKELEKYDIIDSKTYNFHVGDVIKYSKENHELSNACIIKKIIYDIMIFNDKKRKIDYLLASSVSNGINGLWKIYPMQHWIFLLNTRTKGEKGKGMRNIKKIAKKYEDVVIPTKINYDKINISKELKIKMDQVDNFIKDNS